MTTAVIVAAIATTALLAGIKWGQRRRPRPAPTEAELGELAAAGYRPLPPIFVAIVVIGAVGAALAAGVGIASALGQDERDQSDQAQVNRSTCQSVVAADWRTAIDVLLIGATGDQAQVDALVVALEDNGTADTILDGARTPDELAVRGTVLLAEALVNDARIADPVRPLCPFVPGDPSRTPTVPDRDDLDLDTTTSTSTTEQPR